MRSNSLSMGLLCVSAPRPNWPSNGGKLSGTFVHITDLHLQGDYEIGQCHTLRVPLVRPSTRRPRLSDSCHCAGSNTDCGQPICCRAEGGVGRAGHQAGIFGDWACDLAPRMARSLFDAISALDPVCPLYTVPYNTPHYCTPTPPVKHGRTPTTARAAGVCWRAEYSAHGIAPQVPDFIINTHFMNVFLFWQLCVRSLFFNTKRVN